MTQKAGWKSSAEALKSLVLWFMKVEISHIENGLPMHYGLISLETSVRFVAAASLYRQLTQGLADGWNRDSLPMHRGEFGVWEIRLPSKDGQPAIPHASKVKVGANRQWLWK